MRESLFDHLARSLAAPMPRRRALRLAAGALAAVALPGITARTARAALTRGTGACPPGGQKTCAEQFGPTVTECCSRPIPGSGNYTCCPPGECFYSPTTNTCCPKVSQCGNRCCLPGERCVEDECVFCPEGKECGDTCCTSNQLCRNRKCCDKCGGKGTCCRESECCSSGVCRSKPKALATLSGSTSRASIRTLDGSKSKGKIRSFDWTFEAVDCGQVETKAGAKKKGKKVTIKPLCTIKATLTVSDGRCEDSHTITVKVTPRTTGWKTPPLSHRKIDGGAGAPTKAPRSSCVSGVCVASVDGGINLPDCPGTPEVGSAILCPLRSGNSSWAGNGYRLTTISDPGGPFDGFAYAVSSTFEVKRKALINPALLAGAPPERDGNNFYNFNKAKGANVNGFLAAIGQHEGLGAPGRPRTGHSQIIKADLAKPTLDPRHEIERMFSRSKSTLQKEVDDKLTEIDTQLDKNSADPLANLWKGQLWFWDDYSIVWRQGELTVP